MNFRTTYKILIWTGLVLFIAGLVGDANAIPFLRYGAIVGPLLYLIAILIWIPLRIKKPILHPYERNEYRSSLDAVFAFMFNNFVLEFWAFCIAFAMLLTVGGGAAMKSSAGFENAINKIQNHEELKELIGDFRSTGTLIFGNTSPTEANLNFSVYGSTGAARVKIHITKAASDWKINSLEYK